MSFSLINSTFTEAQFGIKLLSDLTSDQLTPCVFSPVSILLSLALVHLGAKGHTRHDIRNSVVNGSTDEQFIEHFSFINKLLNSSVNDVETLIANRLFVSPEQAIRKAFTDELREHYNAETATIDFKKSQEAAKIMNQFISESTKGKIPDMIKPDNLKDVDAILINAIFFQGDWRRKFGEPAESNFSISATENRLVPMLRETRDYFYNKDDEWQVIGIPFKDKSAWFAIFLPTRRFALAENLKSLNAAKFHNLINNVYQEYIFLTFPKFKMDYKINLKTALAKFGLAELFTEQADLSGIGPGLQLASATHQALIEVDQVGTRAAAATEAKIFFTSASSDEPLHIRVDHPFLFAIIKDNSPLFLGTYT
ncbi:Serpin domain-containing protein [Caenorhabditis elegans]|uniref:Serine or cysteine protease inhibitor n=1 Tax=Caenorhabditis elegans TaxID=6239 RepID=G5EE40_CAEEL|nr:Serpin domain-containing protein [Caenorhabditis elegans]AAS13527.1 serine or cysteine protease inhibitor [Caenorhabditis elegans]CCD63235.1 Serpin domain-containing protein [Caenorhabditis elegans]|eukprot:NP_503315.1 SeRPin [Caenorhabditis elegans]